MSSFKENVIKSVNSVPYGMVVSYGQVAWMVGVPRAARQVGWVLHGLDGAIAEGDFQLPWWRVINNAGRISIKGTRFNDAQLQKELLEKEGVVVNGLEIDIEKYRFRPGAIEVT